MDNYFTENRDMQFHLENDSLSDIIAIRENGFIEHEQYPEAPVNETDALDDYGRVLEVIGEIAATVVAPQAQENDTIGALFENGSVTLTEGIRESLLALKEAGVMGFTLPREYGGLNFPKSIYIMAIELISQADASLMTLFGLQEISETIHKFGDESQKENYLPRFCRGEVSGAMALTEPDAGSDLPAIKLKATQDENGQWRLTGVKRFITNGCADIILVAARSEEDIEDARGLSLFIYEREENLQIRRIENKLGIHGSPTCELQFTDAPAELLGQRKRGLLTYTFSLMNGARLGIAAQAVGIMQAAFNEARSYASQRVQYGMKIDQFPQVREMLTTMAVNIEGARALLYESARIVDMKESIEKQIEQDPSLKREKKGILRRYSQYEQLFTPLVKFYATEEGNRLCYDAQQIHGGVGYMKEFTIERLYRDMRITSIYEGTSQMQVIAANGSILRNVAMDCIREYEESYDFSSLGTLFERVHHCSELLADVVEQIREMNDSEMMDLHAIRLVSATANVIISYLYCIDALKSERKRKAAGLFIGKAEKMIEGDLNFILSEGLKILEYSDVILDE